MMSLSLFLYGLALLLGAIVYMVIIKPLSIMIYYKVKYGREAEIFFYPLTGLITFYRNSLQQSQWHTDFLKEAQRKNPHLKIAIFNFFTQVGLYFIETEDIKEALIKHHQNFEKVARFFRSREYFGQGLVLAQGKDWQKQRTLLSNSFHFDSLKTIVPEIVEISDKVAASVNSSQFLGQPIAVLSKLQEITSEVVVRCFYSNDFKDIKVEGNSLGAEVVYLGNSSFIYGASFYFLLKQMILGEKKAEQWFLTKYEKELSRRLSQFSNIILGVIDQRLQTKQSSKNAPPKDFLDLYIKQYLEEHEKNPSIEFDYKLIEHQFFNFLFAGTDTTASLTSVCLYNLAQYPEIAQQVRREILQINPDSSQTDIEVIKKMEYTHCFIQESMRFYYMTSCLFMRKTKTDFSINNFHLQKGMLINFWMYNPMQNEGFYQQPLKFNPDRWMGGFKEAPFSFMPFSIGPQNCIGQHLAVIEAKIIISSFLKLYDIGIAQKYKDGIKFDLQVVIFPYDENIIVLNKRK